MKTLFTFLALLLLISPTAFAAVGKNYPITPVPVEKPTKSLTFVNQYGKCPYPTSSTCNRL